MPGPDGPAGGRGRGRTGLPGPDGRAAHAVPVPGARLRTPGIRAEKSLPTGLTVGLAGGAV
ncbi:hypothetical protein Ate01nite_12020 [Actinoplanes teichomyceticus]|nr:hypothetical protein Ate01nite_12020 [Actinoplanes teichomyceticus]